MRNELRNLLEKERRSRNIKYILLVYLFLFFALLCTFVSLDYHFQDNYSQNSDAEAWPYLWLGVCKEDSYDTAENGYWLAGDYSGSGGVNFNSYIQGTISLKNAISSITEAWEVQPLGGSKLKDVPAYKRDAKSYHWIRFDARYFTFVKMVAAFDSTWSYNTSTYKCTPNNEEGPQTTTDMNTSGGYQYYRKSSKSEYHIFAVVLGNRYDININLNGGTNYSLPSIYYRFGNNKPNVSSIGSATRTGYTFNGYYYGSTQIYNQYGNYNSWVSISGVIGAGDTTLTARWTANTYIITFNKQGGTGGTSSITATYDSYPPSITVPTMTGYKFCGYYTGLNGTGTQYYNSSGDSIRSYTIPSNTTLYAKWELENYYLNFDCNGGSLIDPPQPDIYVEYGQEFEFPTPYRKGHYFNGWTFNTFDNYYGTETIPDFGADDLVVHLTAVWEREEYKLRYYQLYDDYENENILSSTTITYGIRDGSSNDEYTMPTPERAGYLFVGWQRYYDDGSGVLTTYNEKFSGVLYDESEPELSDTRWPDFGVDQEIVVLIAQWTPIEYTIEFDKNSEFAIGSMDDKTMHMWYDYGLPLEKNLFTRVGYNFIGWSRTATGEKEFSDCEFVTNLTTEDKDVVTLYAVWDPITYYINFLSNHSNAEGAMSRQEFKYDEGIDSTPQGKQLATVGYANKGHLFLGWSEEPVEVVNTTENDQVDYINQAYIFNKTTIDNQVFNFYAVWLETWAVNYAQPTKGSGIESDPYLISTAEELGWVSRMYEFEEQFDNNQITVFFKQTADIDLSAHEWLPIGKSSYTFKGTYDGNGYLIKNLKTSTILNIDRSCIGLFGYVGDSKNQSTTTIKNIRLFGSVNGNSMVGGIVGYADYSIIDNCINYAVIHAIDESVGGIAGFMGNTTIKASINYGEIKSDNTFAGGIVGKVNNSSLIKDCYSNGNVRANYYAGGIAGANQQGSLQVSSCAYEGTITALSDYGAIVGTSDKNLTITNCYAKANLPTYTGSYGLCYNEATVENCIFEINGIKRLKGEDFSNWVITSDGRVVPTGLTWLAIGGIKVENINELTEGKDYTQVN